MVKKKILALKDFTLRTTLGAEYLLTEGQVEFVEFGSEREFKNLLTLSSFMEVNEKTPVSKPILILHPPKSKFQNGGEDMGVGEIQIHEYLPECDLECGTQEVIEFHKRVRAGATNE